MRNPNGLSWCLCANWAPELKNGERSCRTDPNGEASWRSNVPARGRSHWWHRISLKYPPPNRWRGRGPSLWKHLRGLFLGWAISGSMPVTFFRMHIVLSAVIWTAPIGGKGNKWTFCWPQSRCYKRKLWNPMHMRIQLEVRKDWFEQKWRIDALGNVL